MKTAFTVPVEKDNNWIKNSFGEIVNKENINSFIPELTLKNSKKLTEQIREQSIAVASSSKNWDNYFNELEKQGQGCIVDLIKNTNDLSKLTGEDLVKANQQARASALAHNEAIKAQTLSAKAGSVALKGFAIAGNMIAMWAISKVILIAAQKLDDFAHAAENAKEKAKTSKQDVDNLTSEISDLNKELETTKNRIEELLEKSNSGTISLVEEEELNSLREQNDELQREIALKEKLAEIDAKEAAENTAHSLTYRTDDNIWDDEYNATDRIDKLQQYVDSANYYQDKLSEINQQILDIEESATDNSYKEDSVYKDLIKHQEEYQKGLRKVEEQMSSTYKELSEEDDGLYYNGKVIEGYEDLVKRLDTVYTVVELYLDEDSVKNTTTDYIDTIKNKLVESGLSEEISNAVAEGFSEEELNSIVNSSSIDWSQCLGSDDATAVIDNIKEQLASVSEVIETPVSLSISDTIDQLNTQLKPAFDSLKSAYQDIFTDDGFTLENVDTSMLSAIKSTIDELNSMEGVDIDVDYSSFEDLAKVLTDSSSTVGEVQDAFNNLASTILSAVNPAISECDGGSYKLLQTLLESMGIVNAEEVLLAELGYSYEEYANAKEAAANTGANLNSGISETIEYLNSEGLMATEDAQQIVTYMMAKAAADGATINVDDTIAQLAKEYSWLAELIAQWSTYNSISQKGHGNSSGTKNLGAGNYTPVQTVKQDVEVEAKFDGSKLTKAAKSAGKSAGKSLKDGLKEELSDIENVISGVTKAIDKQISSIKSQKEEAVAAIDAQIDALNEQKSALEDQKKALEEERDARIEIIEQQKKQLELAIKAIDKQIKAKEKIIKSINDEIDAMKDANAERQRQIDLQKAQYELERLQHQRTILVN